MTRRRKPYRPRPIRAPALVGVNTIWAAPMQLLHDIRHGEVWTVNRKVVMPALDYADHYSAAETLRLFAHVILKVGELRGLTLDTTPLLTLANRLESDMPVDDGALRPVEELFELGRRLANHITPDQAIAILNGHRNVPQPPPNRSPDRPGPHAERRR